jgi:hypothetical protein
MPRLRTGGFGATVTFAAHLRSRRQASALKEVEVIGDNASNLSKTLLSGESR